MQAFKMFKDGRPLADVAIELDTESPTVICYYEDCLKLVNMRKMVAIYNELKDDLPLFLWLYRHIKKERLSRTELEILLKIPKLLWTRRKQWTCIKIAFGISTRRNSNMIRK